MIVTVVCFLILNIGVSLAAWRVWQGLVSATVADRENVDNGPDTAAR